MIITLIAFLLQVGACHTVEVLPTEKALGGKGQAHGSRTVNVTAYVTRDGELHEFEGEVTAMPDGTLLFEPRKPTHEEREGGKSRSRSFSLPRDQVASLKVRRLQRGRTALAVAVGVVGTVVGLALIAIATKESCPFIYSFDGDRWVFDGEPYGAAITRGLERSDLSQLEHLRETDGEYRLLIANEVDETQHTDSLRLVVVDHPAGTIVVGDATGTVHAFAQVAPLLSARNARGHDLTRWLSRDDGVAWEDDPAELARLRPLAGTRDEIDVRFARPTGIDNAWLLARVANTEWASHMLRRSLDWRGSAVREFYAALDADAAFRAELTAWHRREEVFLLGVEVGGAGPGAVQGVLVGGGPFIAEQRALPIDLTNVAGDEVSVRLRPPLGFWSLDWLALAWDERPAHVTVSGPSAATMEADGSEVTALLTGDDDRTLDFPRAGMKAIVSFHAPRRSQGLERTVFALTRGWYEIHLHGLDRAPDAQALEALRSQPGWLVRRAAEEYAEFERTGVLAGVAPGVPVVPTSGPLVH